MIFFLSVVTQSLSHNVINVYGIYICILSLCDRDMRQLLRNWIRIWFLWIGIRNLYYVKKETLSQAFSCKFCESLHNDDFWDFLWIILQIFGRLLLDFLLLNQFFVNVIKIINLTILKLKRIPILMKSRFILSDYCTA